MASDYKINEQSIHYELDGILSTPKTMGEFTTEIRTTEINLKNEKDHEKQNELRTELCLLRAYQNDLQRQFTEKFSEEYRLTVYSYQERLKNQFRSYRNKIAVREFDDQRFCLSLDESICQCISTLDDRFKYYRTAQGHYILVNKADADSLIKITEKINSRKEALKLASNIATLSKNSEVSKNTVAAFTALLKNLMCEEISLTVPPYSVIIGHFLNEAAAINLNPHRTRDQIRESARRLDIELYGHPPLNKRMVAVICAIFAAILGAVVGLAIGADWDSGFEALVETSNLVFAGVGAVSGSGIGSLVGFFGVKSYQAPYEHKRATENKAVQSSREEIYETLRSN